MAQLGRQLLLEGEFAAEVRISLAGDRGTPGLESALVVRWEGRAVGV